MRAIAVAVVILGGCFLQEVSGAHLRSGSLPAYDVHPTMPSVADVVDFKPMHRAGETAAEYKQYAEREKKFEDHRRDFQVSRNAVLEAKAFRSMENAEARQEVFDRIQKKGKLLVKSAEKEAFENLDADEKEEREEEIQEDERSAKIKEQTEEETSNIKEDVEYDRLPKDFEALDHDQAIKREEAKAKVKVTDARLPGGFLPNYRHGEDTPDEPEPTPHLEDAMRGDDKELSDMFFEEQMPDHAKEDSKLEKYIPGFK